MFDDRRDPDGSLYNSSFLRYLKMLFQKIPSTSSKHAQQFEPISSSKQYGKLTITVVANRLAAMIIPNMSINLWYSFTIPKW